MGAIPDRLDVELVGTSRPPVRGSSLPVAPSPLTRKALGPGCDAHDQAWGRGLQVDSGEKREEPARMKILRIEAASRPRAPRTGPSDLPGGEGRSPSRKKICAGCGVIRRA